MTVLVIIENPSIFQDFLSFIKYIYTPLKGVSIHRLGCLSVIILLSYIFLNLTNFFIKTDFRSFTLQIGPAQQGLLV